MLKKIMLVSIMSISTLMASPININKDEVKCEVNSMENKIQCTYISPRLLEKREISFVWYNPDKIIEREKEVIMNINHGSVYDYRYLKGRKSGIWEVKVFDKTKDVIVETTFEIK